MHFIIERLLKIFIIVGKKLIKFSLLIIYISLNIFKILSIIGFFSLLKVTSEFFPFTKLFFSFTIIFIFSIKAFTNKGKKLEGIIISFIILWKKFKKLSLKSSVFKNNGITL